MKNSRKAAAVAAIGLVAVGTLLTPAVAMAAPPQLAATAPAAGSTSDSQAAGLKLTVDNESGHELTYDHFINSDDHHMVADHIANGATESYAAPGNYYATAVSGSFYQGDQYQDQLFAQADAANPYGSPAYGWGSFTNYGSIDTGLQNYKQVGDSNAVTWNGDNYTMTRVANDGGNIAMTITITPAAAG